MSPCLRLSQSLDQHVWSFGTHSCGARNLQAKPAANRILFIHVNCDDCLWIKVLSPLQWVFIRRWHVVLLCHSTLHAPFLTNVLLLTLTTFFLWRSSMRVFFFEGQHLEEVKQINYDCDVQLLWTVRETCPYSAASALSRECRSTNGQ